MGELPGWERDLAERGVELVGRGPELAVAAPDCVEQAVASGASSVIVDGGRGSPALLRAEGFHVQRLLPLPLAGTPVLYLDLDRRRAASYALRHELAHEERWRALRNRAAAVLLGAGLFPPGKALVSVGARSAGRPALVGAAAELGVPADAEWLMLVSPGSITRRNALVLFSPGAKQPGRVLKFSRVPGLTAQFDREERGLELARRAGGSLADHAPHYFGRGEVRGHHLAVESAGVGTRLATLLRLPGSRSRKVAAVERVAEWLIRVARETAVEPPALQPELDRLSREVLPFWASGAAEAAFVPSLERVPASFQHNDMAEDNLIIAADGFVAIDWEWVEPRGIPLSDLFYFGSHVLRLLDGALLEEERDPHFEALVTGRAPSSPTLFRWVRELVAAVGIPADAVAPLVTLSWLDQGRVSAQERRKAEAASGRALGLAYAERCARTWLRNPTLGPQWTEWRR